MSSLLPAYRSSLLASMGIAPAVAALALSGCDAGTPAAQAALADAQLPPPPAILAPHALTGTHTTWQVTGATPGGTVALGFAYGLGLGPCPTPAYGVCLDLASGHLAGMAVADAGGVATFDLLIPSRIADGTSIWFQALDLASQTPSVAVEAVTEHPTRTCGEYPIPDPNNAYTYFEYLVCVAEPSTGCPAPGNVPYPVLERSFQRSTGVPFRGGGGGYDVFDFCFEDTVEDRCCYASEVAFYAIGRPFTVDGQVRTATTTHGTAWADTIELSLSRLPRKVRRRLAASWTETAHGEHASVASFARFQLHLMQLGAPSDLVADATVAMADEIRHAREAFGVATAFAEAPVAPGPLDTAGATDATTVRDIVIATVREGCIAETIAAAQVAEAARRCIDPALSVVLTRTAEDEQRHAALAWRFVRWALVQHPELVDAVAAVFAEPVLTVDRPQDPDARWLAAYGQLSRHDADAVARDVMDEVVGPCARALLAELTGPVVAEA